MRAFGGLQTSFLGFSLAGCGNSKYTAGCWRDPNYVAPYWAWSLEPQGMMPRTEGRCQGFRTPSKFACSKTSHTVEHRVLLHQAPWRTSSFPSTREACEEVGTDRWNIRPWACTVSPSRPADNDHIRTTRSTVRPLATLA